MHAMANSVAPVSKVKNELLRNRSTTTPRGLSTFDVSRNSLLNFLSDHPTLMHNHAFALRTCRPSQSFSAMRAGANNVCMCVFGGEMQDNEYH